MYLIFLHCVDLFTGDLKIHHCQIENIKLVLFKFYTLVYILGMFQAVNIIKVRFDYYLGTIAESLVTCLCDASPTDHCLFGLMVIGTTHHQIDSFFLHLTMHTYNLSIYV